MAATWTTVQTLILLGFPGSLIRSPPCARAPAQCRQWPIGPTNDPPADGDCQLSVRLRSALPGRQRKEPRFEQSPRSRFLGGPLPRLPHPTKQASRGPRARGRVDKNETRRLRIVAKCGNLLRVSFDTSPYWIALSGR